MDILSTFSIFAACQIQVKAASQGKLHMPNEEALSMMEGTFNNPAAWEGLASTAWPAMRRQADRIDAGYLA